MIVCRVPLNEGALFGELVNWSISQLLKLTDSGLSDG